MRKNRIAAIPMLFTFLQHLGVEIKSLLIVDCKVKEGEKWMSKFPRKCIQGCIILYVSLFHVIMLTPHTQTKRTYTQTQTQTHPHTQIWANITVYGCVSNELLWMKSFDISQLWNDEISRLITVPVITSTTNGSYNNNDSHSSGSCCYNYDNSNDNNNNDMNPHNHYNYN